MFVCYDFMNIKLNLSVSYIGSIGRAPLPHPIPFTPRHPSLEIVEIFEIFEILDLTEIINKELKMVAF